MPTVPVPEAPTSNLRSASILLPAARVWGKVIHTLGWTAVTAPLLLSVWPFSVTVVVPVLLTNQDALLLMELEVAVRALLPRYVMVTLHPAPAVASDGLT